jgi:hypothetical protein
LILFSFFLTVFGYVVDDEGDSVSVAGASLPGGDAAGRNFLGFWFRHSPGG